ncbi:hypothetical protein JXR93_02410 [bacterium]|nr:hypothetical protein [bacterium]
MLEKNFVLLCFFIISFIFTDIMKASEDNFEVGVIFGGYTSNGPYLEIRLSENNTIRNSFFYLKSGNDDKNFFELKTSFILELFKERLTEFYIISSIMYSKLPTFTSNSCMEGETCDNNGFNFYGGGVGAGFKFKYFKTPMIICEFHLNFFKNIDENSFYLFPGVVIGIGFDI